MLYSNNRNGVSWIRVKCYQSSQERSQVQRWCSNQPGDGRFHNSYSITYTEYAHETYWWFEHEQDAIIFKLKWGNNEI